MTSDVIAATAAVATAAVRNAFSSASTSLAPIGRSIMLTSVAVSMGTTSEQQKEPFIQNFS